MCGGFCKGENGAAPLCRLRCAQLENARIELLVIDPEPSGEGSRSGLYFRPALTEPVDARRIQTSQPIESRLDDARQRGRHGSTGKRAENLSMNRTEIPGASDARSGSALTSINESLMR